MLNNDIELDLFQTTIQNLTFGDSIPLMTLCEFSYRLSPKSVITDDKTFGFEYNADYINGNKRYNRIIERLLTDDPQNTDSSDIYNCVKTYDKYMLESQIEIYNTFANIIGYNPIEKVLPTSLIESAAYLDGANPDYNTIVKYYPYYPLEKRNGFNFLEFILLLNIDMTLSHRSLFVLDKELNTDTDKKQAENMVKDLVENMKTEKMFKIYVHTFFDVFDKINVEFHNKYAEESIRHIWLTEKYRNRKDAFRALETHLKNEKKMSPSKYEKTQIKNIIKRNNAYELIGIDTIIDNYNAIEYISEEIFTNTFKILLGVFDKGDKEKIKDTKEYELSEEYAMIIKNYIYETISEVEKILNKLYLKE